MKDLSKLLSFGFPTIFMAAALLLSSCRQADEEILRTDPVAEPEQQKEPVADTLHFTVQGAGADEAGQAFAVITDSYFNSDISGYGDIEAVATEAYTHEIFTRLNAEGEVLFMRADSTLFYPNVVGNALAKASEGYRAGKAGVYRIRFNTGTGYLNFARAESAQYTQEGWKNIYMEYTGHGSWKLSDVPIAWYNRVDWGSPHEDRYKFQIYFNESNTWQYYGQCRGNTVQPVQGFWDGCFHLPDSLCSDAPGVPAFTADIILSLNEEGYTHAFADASQVEVIESLEATSAEGMFAMHRAPKEGCVFEGVSTFSAGNVSLTAGTRTFTANCPGDGVYYLVADLDNESYTFTALPELLAEGNAVKGFSSSSGVLLQYKGSGVYAVSGAALTGASGMSPEHPVNEHGKSRLTFVKPSSNYAPQFRRDDASRSCIRNSAWGGSSEIYLNPGTYDISVNLRDFTFSIIPVHNPAKRIAVMGSSVPYGTGAENEKGYTWFYSTTLPSGWTLSNICIPGNNTTDLLRRYDELTADGAGFVLFALSLGNEGIHGAADQQAVYQQWKTNMLSLITKARSDGMKVAVTGSYARGDFNESDYTYTKKLNLDIHGWDVPSINLLGTIDDGYGRWASGYQNGEDQYHPNTAGHMEMSYAIAPSMFEAYGEGKALPARNDSGSLSLNHPIEFIPEGSIHSFSAAFSFKTNISEATLLSIGSGNNSLSISGGKLTYGSITSSASYNNGAWHQIVLCHSYVRGKTFLFIDGVLTGDLDERIAPSALSYGGSGITAREIFFWRSALNPDEVSALADGAILRSSLELYVPLAGGLTDNLAMSKNQIHY